MWVQLWWALAVSSHELFSHSVDCVNHIFFCTCISVSQIRKSIAENWKEGTTVSEIHNIDHSTSKHYIVSVLGTFSNEFMIGSLFTILKDFVNQNQLFKAFKTFAAIQVHASCDIIPLSVSSLLLSCTNLKLVPQGKQLHAHIISLGVEHHPLLVPKLVTFYSTLNLLADAHTVTQNSNILCPLPWNVLLSAYVRNGACREALSAYKLMVAKGIRCDSFTYPTILKACAEESELEFGREVHKSIQDGRHNNCVYVQNALIYMYGRCGNVEAARKLFDTMPEKDAVSWNSIISIYASKCMWKDAFELFESIQVEIVELDIKTWNTIAGGYVKTGKCSKALEVISQMRCSRIGLDFVALIIGLSACSQIGVLKIGKAIHGSSIRSCFDGLDTLKNALITMYSRCGDLTHARILFKLVDSKNTITWNSMISGYTHMDRYEEASLLLREMSLLGLRPNYVTIASILPLCARVANLQHGKEFHCYILKREEFKSLLLLWNSLVDMYARSGRIFDAKTLFDSLSKKDEVTYTSLIAGYGMQGEGQVALRLFNEMIKLQIIPDHITYIAVLSACSHSGLVTQGEILFEQMQRVHGITPLLEHFSCMIDLLGRAGFINKAKEMLMQMQYRPTPAMWASFIGACQIYRNTEMGKWAAEKLLEARPNHSGYYVLIANMYAAAKCWSKLAEVRSLMRDSGVRKSPGCAWVDVGSGFQSFLVGDKLNSHAPKIYPLLEGLNEVMKDAGCSASQDLSFYEYEGLNAI